MGLWCFRAKKTICIFVRSHGVEIDHMERFQEMWSCVNHSCYYQSLVCVGVVCDVDGDDGENVFIEL